MSLYPIVMSPFPHKRGGTMPAGQAAFGSGGSITIPDNGSTHTI